MGNSERIDVSRMIQKPFGAAKSERAVLTKWFEMNDDLSPAWCDPKVWEAQCNLIQTQPDGKQALATPQSIKLWNMVALIESIQGEMPQNLKELGLNFRNAGIYLARRLDSITEGKSCAKSMALAFYKYGDALLTGTWDTKVKVKDIARLDLTQEATADVDRFLEGEKVNEARRAKVDRLNSDQVVFRKDTEEKFRRKSLAQFFHTENLAVLLEKRNLRKKARTKSPPSAHTWFLESVIRHTRHAIEMPKGELFKTIFERGRSTLLHEMKEKQGPEYILYQDRTNDIKVGHQAPKRLLPEALHLSQKGYELAATRKNGNVKEIAGVEHEIADVIHRTVASYEFLTENNDPTEIVRTQKLNCLGGAMLMGVLLEQVGIKFLDVVFPNHVTLLVPLADGTLVWYDTTHPEIKIPLPDDAILLPNIVTKKNAATISTQPAKQTLWDFINGKITTNPVIQLHYHTHDGSIGLLDDFNGKFGLVMKQTEGQLLSLLTNTSSVLARQKESRQSVDVLKIALSRFPNVGEIYQEFGLRTANKKRYKQAIKHYRLGLKLNRNSPNKGELLFWLTDALGRDKSKKEALKAIQDALDLDPLNDKYNFILALVYHAMDKPSKGLVAAIAAYVLLASKVPEH